MTESLGKWIEPIRLYWILKPKGGFPAYPDGFEAEFTDKPHPQSAEGA